MTIGSAPGKLILFGEHAVVYGRTAIAVPVDKVRANAEISPYPEGENGQVFIEAPQIEFASWLHDLPQNHPFSMVVRLTLEMLQVDPTRPLKIRVESNIPIAAGMGSSAATSIAIIRGLSAHFNQSLSPEKQSGIAYEVEKIHHGTPSGVDNTVIAYERPVIFSRDKELRSLEAGADIPLVIGDTGIQSETARAIAQVRTRRQAESARFDSLFDQISIISEKAAEAIQSGRIADLGPLMNQNQSLLADIGVSSEPLRTLIQAALDAGASGAKLSGAGLGGNMIALVQTQTSHEIASALHEAGAVRTIETVIAK